MLLCLEPNVRFQVARRHQHEQAITRNARHGAAHVETIQQLRHRIRATAQSVDGNRGRYTKVARPKTLRFVWEDAMVRPDRVRKVLEAVVALRRRTRIASSETST